MRREKELEAGEEKNNETKKITEKEGCVVLINVL